MPITVAEEIIRKANALGSAHPWALLVKVILPGGEVIRVCHNNQSLTYQGEEYLACNMKVKPGQQTSSGEIPTHQISFADPKRVYEYYLQKYKGGVDSQAYLRIVNTELLDKDSEPFTMEVSIQSAERQGNVWITFSLGAPNPMKQALLDFLYMSGYCNWVIEYRGPGDVAPECGYAGTLSTCDGTLEDCINHENEANFGGHPGLANTNYVVLR